MDTLLWPLKVAVAWVMVTIHKALVLIGFPDGPGIAWVLSIIGLTIVVRLLIMPLFVKQIRASRGLQLLQPCLLYTSPSPRDLSTSRMPSSA